MAVAAPIRFTITQSVGQRGANRPEDVIVVQTLLREANEEAGEAHLDPGPADGNCTPRTIRAIEVFQARFSAHGDGRVDPNGRTLRNLLKVTYHDGGVCSPLAQSARELVKVLLPHQGEKYVFGAAVPKENPNWIGPWDCAEFVAWGIFQVAGRYVGCKPAKAPNNVGYMNGYTGYFATDLPACARKISEAEAAETPGAIALRSPGTPGHIAVSRGGNRTIEAASTKLGVKSLNLRGRSWTSFWRLNFLAYELACGMV